MKKEYIQPQAKKYNIGNEVILAGSVIVDSGNTSEQNAKEMNFDFSDDED